MVFAVPIHLHLNACMGNSNLHTNPAQAVSSMPMYLQLIVLISEEKCTQEKQNERTYVTFLTIEGFWRVFDRLYGGFPPPATCVDVRADWLAAQVTRKYAHPAAVH